MKAAFNLIKNAMALLPTGQRTLFDGNAYRERYPDVSAAGMDPYQHFIRFGNSENREPCLMFDPQFYRNQIGKTVKDPTRHYLMKGAKAGFDPHPQFQTKWYLEVYPDVARSGLNPLVHYQKYGVKEGRRTAPEFQRSFGSIMPSAFGLKLPHFSSVTFASFSKLEAKSSYLSRVAIPLQIANERHASLCMALSLTSECRISEIQVCNLELGNEVTLLFVMSHCRIIHEANKWLRVSFQEVQLLRIITGVPSLLEARGAGSTLFAA